MTDVQTYSLMQTGTPYKSYIKTILGKIYITVLDPFSSRPEGMIIEGNPKGNTKEDCIIDIWDEKGNAYFVRANKRHFEMGNLIEYKRKQAKPEKSANEITDEELEEILNSKFFTLQNKLNKFTSVAPVFRMLDMAQELEKSEKIIKTIEAKLSEIQSNEYGQQTEEE